MRTISTIDFVINYRHLYDAFDKRSDLVNSFQIRAYVYVLPGFGISEYYPFSPQYKYYEMFVQLPGRDLDVPEIGQTDQFNSLLSNSLYRRFYKFAAYKCL